MKPVWWLLIGLVIFLIRFQTSLQATENLDRYTDKPISINGKISSQINLQGSNQSFNVGRVRVRTNLYPAYEYGDRLVISGTLQRQVINPWYSRFSLIYPGIKRVTAGNNIFIGFKNKLAVWYTRVLPEPEAGLLAGIVLGSKRGLPQDFWQALQKTGTLHIVVASGYNVTVVMGAVVFLFAGILPRLWAMVLAMIAVGAYSIMAGLEPAIVRAAIMGTLAYFGQALGKPRDGVRLLAAAAGAMLLINPLFLFDVGFQLSVMATLGILLVCPRLPRLPQGVGESLAAQLFVWPILLYNFGRMSLFGILVNSLIAPLVPYVMILGFLPWLAYVPLHLIVVIINRFG
ncbi:hypothetical protein A3I57_01255 [Candidatus Beckwithbacteria bacterium RIFCSPLOWO2_02_FULL_47_23]|uniref:ComEC/Rec2-related protein domain-containing protein n=2 Tax=Candidatus Beckwithiibacteriota TaxID=1752726 RepID=A0A1F5E3G3_9BACT|nr:MAG: hypothetical protein A3E73_02775 [Candidatus Beckwithbacteria bacterium RIFCSPHIGHO2_12_FULL_47_17]OGD61898.1 MAG: hypothetical protein A3I57_01255 [Candidatus Beckwithbacteria bacterium RIFCSPLOWO2_02_FULL_47_23]